MKKIILLITICLAQISNALNYSTIYSCHHPGETEKWLVETINKYMKADTIHHFIKTTDGWIETMMTEYTPDSFTIRDDHFLITYSIINKDPGPVKMQKTKLQASYVVSRFIASAPIRSLEKLITRQKKTDNDSNRYSGGSYLAIQYNEQMVEIKEKSYAEPGLELDQLIETTAFLPLFINPQAEPGLITRLQAALATLKTFYKTPQNYSIDWTYPLTKHSIISQEKKLGMIDSNNRIIIPLVYDKLIDFNDGLARVEQNDKVGFVDEQGKLVIPCMYEPDTLIITGAQIWHVMNANGGESIAIGATPERKGFTEGLACVIQNGKYGFINKANKTVIPFQYDGADNFLDSIAIVKQNDKYGAIDKTGKIIIPLIYDLLVWESPNSWEPLLFSKKDGECFLMDKDQKRIRGCFE